MANIKENSTNSVNRRFLIACNMTYAMEVIGGRWKLLILAALEKKTLRFGELNKSIPKITERMLTLQLRELETDGLINRTAYAEIPPKVEYNLTQIGKDLLPICIQLSDWGGKHKQELTA